MRIVHKMHANFKVPFLQQKCKCSAPPGWGSISSQNRPFLNLWKRLRGEYYSATQALWQCAWVPILPGPDRSISKNIFFFKGKKLVPKMGGSLGICPLLLSGVWRWTHLGSVALVAIFTMSASPCNAEKGNCGGVLAALVVRRNILNHPQQYPLGKPTETKNQVRRPDFVW